MKATAQTIENCYMNSRFKASEEAHLIQTVQEKLTTASFRNVWDRLSLVYGDNVCQIDDYLTVDENAATSSIMTGEKIINAVQNATENVSDNDQDDEDENENEEQPKVRLTNVYSALRTLRIYGLQMQNHAMEDVKNPCEIVLLRISQNNLKQKKLT